MSNVSIAGYAGWLAYDMFLIVSLSDRPVYDPNPLRPNPNPKKPMSGSCRVCGLGRILTPLKKTHNFNEFIYYDNCFISYNNMILIITAVWNIKDQIWYTKQTLGTKIIIKPLIYHVGTFLFWKLRLHILNKDHGWDMVA